MIDIESELKELSTVITKRICDVDGYIFKTEAHRLCELEHMLGKRYDAINSTWVPLDREE